MEKFAALVHLAEGLMAGHCTANEAQDDDFYTEVANYADRLYEALRTKCIEDVPEPEPIPAPTTPTTVTKSAPIIMAKGMEPTPPLPDETPSDDGPDAPDADLPSDLDPENVFPEAEEPTPGYDCEEQGCDPNPGTGLCTYCGADFSKDPDWVAARDAATA